MNAITWKYGAQLLFDREDDICPDLLDLSGVPSQLGLPVKMSSVVQLTFNLPSCLVVMSYQVEWFLKKHRESYWDMYAMVLPATWQVPLPQPGRAVALTILKWLYLEKRSISPIAPMDMRTMVHAFGRPEMAVANVMTAQLARFYQASFGGHAALTDAKFPSPESSAQKAMTGAVTLLAGGSLLVDAVCFLQMKSIRPSSSSLIMNWSLPLSDSFTISRSLRRPSAWRQSLKPVQVASSWIKTIQSSITALNTGSRRCGPAPCSLLGSRRDQNWI
jgi:hypothetical protein